jgi:O-antigen/teichoic acid export membrane protein
MNKWVASIVRRIPFAQLMVERINNHPIGYRLAKGVFWSVVGTVISRGLTLLAMLFVARILGKSGFGELGMIESSIGMFGTFAGFGLAITATKYVGELRITDPDRAGRILGLSGITALSTGIFFTVILFLFAPWFTSHILNASHLEDVFKIGAFLVLLNAVNGAQLGALAGFEAFKAIARINLFCGLISFPMLITGAFVNGLTGTVCAQVLNLVVNCFLSYLTLRKEAYRCNIPILIKSCTQEMPILWKFSLPAVLGYIMVGPANWGASAILVNQPDGYSEMGIFAATNQWYVALMFIPRLLGNVMLPVLSEFNGQDKMAESHKILITAIKTSVIVTLPIIIIASIASPFIMSLYGEGFRQGWPTFIVILLTTALEIIITTVGASLAASGKLWISFKWNACWAVSFLFLTQLLIDFGALGLAAAKFLSYLGLTTYIIIYIIKLSPSKEN